MANLAVIDNNDSNINVSNGFICTLDITDVEGKIKLANALNGATSLNDVTDKVLRVTDVVTTKGVRSRTGEECVNTYLICDDNSVYFTQSGGIARSIEILVGIFTDQNTGKFNGFVEQGVGLAIQENKMANGNTLKTLVPAKLD